MAPTNKIKIKGQTQKILKIKKKLAFWYTNNTESPQEPVPKKVMLPTNKKYQDTNKKRKRENPGDMRNEKNICLQKEDK